MKSIYIISIFFILKIFLSAAEREEVYAAELTNFIDQTNKYLGTEGLATVSDSQMLAALGLEGNYDRDKTIILQLSSRKLPDGFVVEKEISNNEIKLILIKESTLKPIVFYRSEVLYYNKEGIYRKHAGGIVILHGGFQKE